MTDGPQLHMLQKEILPVINLVHPCVLIHETLIPEFQINLLQIV